MVRHVHCPNTETFCYPGAQVLHINSKLHELLRDNPSASTVVTHVGSNDIKLQQSEKLKDDFKTLIDTVLESGRQCVISGPLPSPRFGDVKFSRMRQLHIWLKKLCCTMGIPFVDNFHVFWKRPDLFARDGLHLNGKGKRLLAHNIELTLKSCRPAED